MHSHNYRAPDRFSGLRVACIGAGPSGTDIAIELASHAEKVYLCHDKPRLESLLPKNLIQTSSIGEFFEEGAILSGSKEKIDLDAVVYCTGYEYDIPFLDQGSISLRVQPFRITPLYQHLVVIDHPTMFLIGMCTIICPFPHFDVQVRFALATLTNPNILPTRRDMLSWEEEDYRQRMQTLGPKKSHFLGPMQWEYMNNLAKMAHFDSRIMPVVGKLYQHVHTDRGKHLATYKSTNYQIVDADQFLSLDQKTDD